jgi:hypothetical protein
MASVYPKKRYAERYSTTHCSDDTAFPRESAANSLAETFP